MTDLLSQLRAACGTVAGRARSVAVAHAPIPGYASGLPVTSPAAEPDPGTHVLTGSAEHRAAFWLTLDAINFGSGWFPTLRKRPGRSGYFTVAAGVRRRFGLAGPWRADELADIQPREIAATLGQDPDHELMVLFARSLRDLGAHIAADHDGRFTGPVDAAEGSVRALVATLGRWECFADVSAYDELEVPFLKRAQIAAADLCDAGVGNWHDAEQLTMFADNLVPHVLRVDGILEYEPQLLARIERGELIEHGSPEEVEIRACALHAVELIVAARVDASAAQIDRLLWHRGQHSRYKALPRHRTRCRAY